MKKLLCIALCLLTAVCFVGCKDKTEENEPPLMELMSRSLSAEHEFAIVDEDNNVVLKNADVKSVLIMYKKGQNRYLELRFTDEGAKNFKKASKKSDLSITLDGKVLTSNVFANEENNEYAKITGIYEEIIGYFNEMT